MTIRFTVPGMTEDQAAAAIHVLDGRLVSLIDLALTLKHVHWNVTGRSFIAVHEMLDPQVETIRTMVDDTAERIATLGGTPVGTPGALVDRRTWADYELGRSDVVAHLAALDKVLAGVIADHRSAQTALADLDLVSEDMIIGHLVDLEQFQWFIRSHLDDVVGDVDTAIEQLVGST